MRFSTTRRTKLFFLAIAAIVLVGTIGTTRAQSPNGYRVLDLGVLPGGVSSYATAINIHGEVVGRALIPDPATPGSWLQRAFYWKDRNGNGQSDPGEMIALGTLGGRNSEATGINDAGVVVGMADTVDTTHAFRWEDLNHNGVADPGEMQDLGTVPGAVSPWLGSWALGIGNSGDIAATGSNGIGGFSCDAVWLAGVWQKVPHCGEQANLRRSGNNPVNANGQMVGGFSNGGAPVTPYVYDSRTGAFQNLGPIGVYAQGINDAGQVIGNGSTSGGFVWQNGIATDLTNTLPNGAGTEPTHINNLGQVLGVAYAIGGAGHPFLWQDTNNNHVSDSGEMIDVTNRLPAGFPSNSLELVAVNDVGQLAGADVTSGSGHAVVLTPTAVLITTPSLPDGAMALAYSASLSAEYGSTPYTWSLVSTSPSLPAGLSLSASGLITGTPTVAGTFLFTVQVSDATSPAATDVRTFRLRIFPVSLSAFGTPAVDGVLSAGEWDNAACQSLVVNVPGGGTTPARLCVMNDAQKLYVALRFNRAAADPGNSLGVEFDNDNDGIAENGDDVMVMNPDVGFTDIFRTNIPPCPAGLDPAACGLKDVDDSGTNDGTGAFANDGTISVYEMSHPLKSGDAGHDFALTPGDAVGFWIMLRTLRPPSQYPQDFGDTYYPDVRFFGRIIIASTNAPTPMGRNIVAQPADAATGSTPVTLTFDEVTQAGNTTVTSIPPGPSPPGFTLGIPPVSYEIATTATFSGKVSVCVSYAGVSFGGSPPQLYHYENGTPVDVTTSVDTVNQIICGRVSSFSPFAVLAKVDTTPPLITCRVSPNLLWPPNHQMVPVKATVTVTDAESGPAGFTLTSVTSSEPDSGVVDGDRPNDIQGLVIGTAGTSGLLRAERSGAGRGRIYTLTYTARDLAGNAATCAATVTVPHDRRR